MLSESVNPADLNNVYQIKKYLDDTISSLPIAEPKEIGKHLLTNILLLRDSLQRLILEKDKLSFKI